MAAALQIYHTPFDAVFLKLPPALRYRVEDRIDEMGLSLDSYPHYRLTGSNRYCLRVGDYRIIYTFDTARNTIHLLAIGHRPSARDIPRQLSVPTWR